jgi:hypothetical protein
MAKSLPCGYELRVSREREVGLWRLEGLEPCDRSGSCCPSASNAPWHGRSRRGRSFLAPSFLLGGEEGARCSRQSSAGVGNIQGTFGRGSVDRGQAHLGEGASIGGWHIWAINVAGDRGELVDRGQAHLGDRCRRRSWRTRMRNWDETGTYPKCHAHELEVLGLKCHARREDTCVKQTEGSPR